VFGLSLSQVSAGVALVVVVAFVVWLLLTDRLVTRRRLEDVREDRDARVAEAHALAAMWREAFEFERTARERFSGHSQAAIEAARTTAAVLQALPSPEGSANADPVA